MRSPKMSRWFYEQQNGRKREEKIFEEKNLPKAASAVKISTSLISVTENECLRQGLHYGKPEKELVF
jgi:hypothetical protein